VGREEVRDDENIVDDKKRNDEKKIDDKKPHAQG
jgi:hypothetical protein